MILMNGHYKKNVNPEVHQDDELRDFLGLELTGLTELTVNSCFFILTLRLRLWLPAHPSPMPAQYRQSWKDRR